ncbi:4Fe-4S single cluster domain-containing protein [Streptomyces sp. NPDC048172]|uniref:4Fe-4S single cluster domain-containing protein n=1 Tax=Streptomyces sp. NPDC048172 TaxID=3365505 RepID=UPI00371A5592
MAAAVRGRAATPWRLHATLPRSEANGPGVRYVIWSQGCSLGCPGCFNPSTHPGEAPLTRTVEGVVADVLDGADGLEGVTLSGGEPLEQPCAVAEFCARIKECSSLGIIVLTGLTRGEIEADRDRAAAVADADLVVAGRYNARRHHGRGTARARRTGPGAPCA